MRFDQFIARQRQKQEQEPKPWERDPKAYCLALHLSDRFGDRRYTPDEVRAALDDLGMTIVDKDDA